MLSESDKRAFDRIEIPGAFVMFRKRNKFGFLERSSKPMQLFNLTKSGICFECDKKFYTGEPVCVNIQIPGEQSLRLYGKIRWIGDDLIGEAQLIGAQFSAFGKGRNYNPVRSLDHLRTLQNKYGN